MSLMLRLWVVQVAVPSRGTPEADHQRQHGGTKALHNSTSHQRIYRQCFTESVESNGPFGSSHRRSEKRNLTGVGTLCPLLSRISPPGRFCSRVSAFASP